MSNLKSTSLALAITIALTATETEVRDVIRAIENHFGLSDDNSISPTEAAAIVAPPVVTSAIPVTDSLGTVVGNVTAQATVDNTGMPWDARIHSSSKGFNADGSWRKIKGGDKAAQAKIETDIRSTLGLTTVTAAPAALAAPALAGLPPIPGALAAPAPVANPVFTGFVQFIVDNSPPISPEWLKASLLAFGVADGDLQNLAHAVDKIPAIEAAIRTAIGK